MATPSPTHSTAAEPGPAISLFELFRIGIGPSSSHTVGPMEAARRFASGLRDGGLLAAVQRLRIDLYGALGATGRGHGTGPAVLMGLEGAAPDTVDPDAMRERTAARRETGELRLAGERSIALDEATDLVYHKRESLPEHPNGLILTALGGDGDVLRQRTYYSVGGGFIRDPDSGLRERNDPVPFPFATADALLRHCRETGLRVSDLARANERLWRDDAAIDAGIDAIWAAMQDCVQRGLAAEGELPGGLHVRRRAAALHRQLRAGGRVDRVAPALAAMDWVNVYALAVNEENAAGGRVVTAPTNGAAGIIPAVLHYYRDFVPDADPDGVRRFLLTAAAIGGLIKRNASISGAEVGCQGEVGAACAMAAAGLAEVCGGSPEQVENAAEIGLEHHLGMTCDPVAGLVQIPCIERNAVAAMKAINAATLALRGDGQHYVSLDKAIRTLRETGRDMLDKYKETARGGLAVNVIEC
ncbi:L-serine ammonia-lyase [Sediminicurvatus halobius]|uniref:L-serine dehydratase n=1 Tax=Sediminicurvatus halobius TaxID=2182432 RepID=A0A2U2N160_9GAMM|nr:L-serine ammonia-lyase [Spiribacter halobius]PWG62783.1 L-serine ammonia-lyase [Spiribacter halobius]UEX77071.1 L-serine ammonia-lyase [Spiribacter halobius]